MALRNPPCNFCTYVSSKALVIDDKMKRSDWANTSGPGSSGNAWGVPNYSPKWLRERSED